MVDIGKLLFLYFLSNLRTWKWAGVLTYAARLDQLLWRCRFLVINSHFVPLAIWRLSILFCHNAHLSECIFLFPLILAFYIAYILGMPTPTAYRAPPWSSGSVLDYRSLSPVFKSRRGHIWRLFRLWLLLITFGGRSAHLAYRMHKSGRKTSIIIIILGLTSKRFQFSFSFICWTPWPSFTENS